MCIIVMTDKETNLLLEYEFIKTEINQKIELHNTLITFTITTVIGILAFALSQDRTLLYITPFFLIIPMSIRIRYYRSSMTKLSAYLIVFLEPKLASIKWETRNTITIQSSLNAKKHRGKNKRHNSSHLINILHNYECLILSIATYGFYLLDYLKDKSFSYLTIVGAMFPLIFIILELIITKDMNSLDAQKKDWIKKWESLRYIVEQSENSEYSILSTYL